MTVDCLTFGDGLPRYRRAAERVAREARNSGLFSSVHAARITDLGADFMAEHSSILNERGLGYWLWKPYLVRDWFATGSGDFLLYVDGGCVLNLDNGPARQRFGEYVQIAADATITCFGTGFPERVNTKMDLLHRLDLPDEKRRSQQIMGGIFVISRCHASLEFVEQWWNVAVESDYHFLDDSPSVDVETPDFREHRHDQSIFSCLAKKQGIEPQPDETWFAPDWPESARHFPIWAPRHSSGRPFRPSRATPLADFVWRSRESIEYRLHTRHR